MCDSLEMCGILGRIKTQSLRRTGCLSSLHGYLSRLLAVLFCDCSCNWAGILAGWEILKYGFETSCDFFFLESFKLKGFISSHNGNALFKSVQKVKSSRTWQGMVINLPCFFSHSRVWTGKGLLALGLVFNPNAERKEDCHVHIWKAFPALLIWFLEYTERQMWD